MRPRQKIAEYKDECQYDASWQLALALLVAIGIAIEQNYRLALGVIMAIIMIHHMKNITSA